VVEKRRKLSQFLGEKKGPKCVHTSRKRKVGSEIKEIAQTAGGTGRQEQRAAKPVDKRTPGGVRPFKLHTGDHGSHLPPFQKGAL